MRADHKLWERIHFRVFGVWPDSVVNERMEKLERQHLELEDLVSGYTLPVRCLTCGHQMVAVDRYQADYPPRSSRAGAGGVGGVLPRLGVRPRRPADGVPELRR